MAEELSQNEIIEDAQIQQWVEANVPGEDADQVEEVEVSEEEYAAEEPEVEAAEEPETETRVSRNFARMKQKERDLQKQQRELHSEREALRPFKEAQEASSSGDMLGALEKVGWDYNRATDQVFKDGKLAPQAEQQAAPEVQQKLDQLDQYMKKEKMDKYVGAIKDIVDTDENYSLIRAKWAESVPMILQMQQISMNEENRVMDPEELLDKAEAYYENLFQTVVSTEKGRKLYSQIEAGDGTPQDSPSKNPQRTRSRTLRNQVSRPKSKTSKRGPMTEREQLEAAIAAVNWT
tara:strand:+ start:787 stop:1662 length:876 start_codon:yes stop_codon:yes gene_type:complete